MALTFDVSRFDFESAGALGFVNEYSGLAAQPALYIGFAESMYACPFLQSTTSGGNYEASSTPSFTAFVGIDWADKKHDFCIQAAGSDQRVCGTSLGVQVDTNQLSLLEDTDSL